MECPRCHSHLAGTLSGGPYRAALPRCAPCGLTLLSPRDLPPQVDCRIGDSALVSAKTSASESCPACLIQLQRLTLTSEDAWVETEECASCGLVVVDDGELERIRAFLSGLPSLRAAERGLVAGGTERACEHVATMYEDANQIAMSGLGSAPQHRSDIVRGLVEALAEVARIRRG